MIAWVDWSRYDICCFSVVPALFALSIPSEYILSCLSFWSFPSLSILRHLMHVRLRIPISCPCSPEVHCECRSLMISLLVVS